MTQRSTHCTVLLAMLLLPCSAFAYIDPNTGGLFFQLLAPLFAGVVGAWMFLRRSISTFVRGLWLRLTRSSH
jgi:hypothetical protein